MFDLVIGKSFEVDLLKHPDLSRNAPIIELFSVLRQEFPVVLLVV